MADEISDRIKDILAEQASIKVTDMDNSKTPEELGIDSLALVESIFAIEEEFDIDIPFNANITKDARLNTTTVGSTISAIVKIIRDSKP